MKNDVVIDYHTFSVNIKGNKIFNPNVKFDKIYSLNCNNTDDSDDITYIQNIKGEILDSVNNGDFENTKVNLSSLVLNYLNNEVNDSWGIEKLFQFYPSDNIMDKRGEGVSQILIENDKEILIKKNNDFGLDNGFVNVVQNMEQISSELVENEIMVHLDTIMCPKQENVGENIVDFMGGIKSIAESLEGYTGFQKENFIRKMSRFQKLFTPKDSSADTMEYHLKIKPHKNIIRKSYPVPFKFRPGTDKKNDRNGKSGYY